jgi:hypothetical protein
LLRVPRYDFNWQHTYEFTDRIPLANIDQVEFTATFDNSIDNPFNPDPKEFVMWGDQTWEEMAVAFFEVSRPRVRSDSKSSLIGDSMGQSHAQPSSRAIAYADDFIRSMDRDGNETISWAEATSVVRDYSFHRLDGDRDGNITRDELIAAVDERRGR